MARPRGRIDEAKHAYWLQVLVQWRESKLTVREFCRRHRHHESQFWFWKRRLTSQLEATRVPADPAFVPVTIVDKPSPTASTIDIRLANGHRLRVRAGCDRRLLADVVAALEGKPC
jgi:hypothetical protein